MNDLSDFQRRNRRGLKFDKEMMVSDVQILKLKKTVIRKIP
jgi:hypothetical protein